MTKIEDLIEQMLTLRSARQAWQREKEKFESQQAAVLTSLILRAIEQRMSVEQVSVYTGATKREVRSIMRSNGLDPKAGKGFIAAAAAEALHNNAYLLGIDPSEMDLMSPLAYLPAGSLLKKAAREDDE